MRDEKLIGTLRVSGLRQNRVGPGEGFLMYGRGGMPALLQVHGEGEGRERGGMRAVGGGDG